MKKILALVLALTMIVGMSIPAFAASTTVPAPTNFAVEADYVFVGNTDTVYGVDVSWEPISFTYTVKQGQWNPDAEGGPAYEDDISATWDKDSDETEIKVVNKSNAAIVATASWTDGDDLDVADATFTAALNLASAVNVTNKANEGTITATVTINKGAVLTEDATIGTITVTITAA